MDYRGTDKDDLIDQRTLGLTEHSNFYGGAGNDTITLTFGNAVGEAGNDTIINAGTYVGAAYWTSPAGVKVNLATGIALDGYGGTDTLSGVREVQDSPFDDQFIGSAASESFWLSRGNDRVEGGGGADTVVLYGVKSTDVSISYDRASDTFTLGKHLPDGDSGTHTLKGIGTISFIGAGSDEVSLHADMFDDSSGFVRAKTSLASGNMDNVMQLRTGDFNGDGNADLLVARSHNADMGITPSPLQVLLGDGAGGFSDKSATLFADGIPYVKWVPRIFTADFNNDGISDIFAPDFGVDAEPFPGGQNSLYLSSTSTGLIGNATATLPQGLRQNHGTSVGDVNKDGFLDLFVNALHETTGNANQLLINDGSGHFAVSQTLLPASMSKTGYDPGYTWSMLRDLNNDGYDDIVLGTWQANPLPSQVLLNDGHGSFAGSSPVALPRSGLNMENVIGIETIDLNGDALPDLMLSVTNGGTHGEFYTTPYLQLLVNDGNGRFHDETQARLAQSTALGEPGKHNWYLSATAVDVNRDGYQDIVADGIANARSKVYLNDGHGNFSVTWQAAPFAHIVAADLTGDGMPDLVESSQSGYSVLVNAFPHLVSASHEYRAGERGEKVLGTALADTVYGGKGNDAIDGGAGIDKVVFAGKRADYTVVSGAAGYTVTGSLGMDGTDTLVNVERIEFADKSMALDIEGTGGQVYRLYQAAFNRAPDAGGLGFHMSVIDKHGVSLLADAQSFIDSAEFKQTYGSVSNEQFVTLLYANVLHREPDAAGFKFHVDLLNAHIIGRADDLLVFSESAENKSALIGIIGNGFEYIPFG